MDMQLNDGDCLFFVYYPFLIFPISEIRERFRAGEDGGEAPRARRVLVPARYAVAVSASLSCYKTERDDARRPCAPTWPRVSQTFFGPNITALNT
jgi:hypothetical protein